MMAVVLVSAINPTSILVEFNTDVPAENAAKENFTVSAGTLEAVNVSGKTATLSMKGLNYGQSVTVKVVEPAHEATVVIPKVEDLYKLEISTDAEGNTIKADGATKMQVEIVLKDKLTGEIVDKDGVVDFTATRGGLGQQRSALQKGKAYVQLTSIASPTSVTSIVTAVLAEVPGSEEFEGLTGQKSVFFTPDGAAEEVEFVRPMSAESTQGDRFFVQFSAPIKAAEYKAIVEATNWPAARKYGVEVNGQAVNVSDVRNVTEDTLEFILDVDQVGAFVRIEQPSWTTQPNNYLRDNVTHTVTFPNKIGKLVLDETTGIDFILTDTSRPAVLGVTAKDQLEFTVRFTETVDRNTVIGENFLLDGKAVEVNPAPDAAAIATAKANNKVIVTSLTVGKYWKGTPRVAVDERNQVTFVLHKDFALASGSHQIQIANVGDYAQDVDPVQNKVVTDTFDFSVTADTSIPVPTITVQSPEQWRVDFDKAVYGTTGKKVEDVFNVKSKDSDDTFVMGTDYMVSSINKNGTTGTALVPSASASTLDGEQYFLIEFLKDWTVKYDTQSNPLKTYFASTKNPYTVTIENLESSIGNKMSKKDLNVNLAYDGVSPEIANAEQAKDIDGNLIQAVDVEMTEPIKNVKTTQEETITPSQQQTVGAGVPEPTYEFVKGDKVVEGQATGYSYDDYRFTLTPKTTLEAGEWTLYIRSISDDIGNTSATVSKKVVIETAEAEATDTQIAWAAFDDADGGNKLLFDTTAHGDKDVIYVKYTKEMKAGGANGVDRTQNYVFMGQPLPTGSQVLRGIEGVTKDWDGVTIVMPKGTWDGVGGGKDDFTVALNIASNFQAADGEKLSGDYEVELTDTTTDNTTLGGGFEAVYYGAIPFENDIATTKAVAEGNTDGNISKITLTADSGAYVITDVIYVNGKKFTSTAPGDFTPDTGVEVKGTATDGLKITSANGAIIVNTSQVVDSAKPVITKTVLSSDKKTVTLTFSEPVTKATNGTFLELVKTDFAVSAGTIDSVEHNAATANTVVLKLDTAVVPGVTVNAVASSVYDFAQPANDADTTAVTLMPAYATAPTTVTLAGGSTDPFTDTVTNVSIPVEGATDTTGVLETFAANSQDTFKFTVTDAAPATSTITIDGVAYTSGDDYTVTAAQATAGTVEIVVTTTEVGKTTAVRTFVVAVN